MLILIFLTDVLFFHTDAICPDLGPEMDSAKGEFIPGKAPA